jgi:hypothetical protein
MNRNQSTLDSAILNFFGSLSSFDGNFVFVRSVPVEKKIIRDNYLNALLDESWPLHFFLFLLLRRVSNLLPSLEETIVGPSGFTSLLFGFVFSTEPFVGDRRINVTVALLRTFRPHDFFFFDPTTVNRIFFCAKQIESRRPFCQRKE